MSIKAYGLALALVLVPAAAFAQSAAPQTAAPETAAPSAAPQAATPEARARMRAACGADVLKFCANVERAKGAMRSCLEAHATQLSDGCKAARAERAAARAKAKG
jgi:hypothetical protein